MSSSNALKYSLQDVIIASRVGDVKWLEKVLSIRQSYMYVKDEKGFSCLHVAAMSCTLDSLKLLIDQHNIDINMPTESGWTALHLCIDNITKAKSLECLKYLLKKKANIHSKTNSGLTPLHLAGAVGNLEEVKILLDKGAVVDVKDSFGKTALLFATMWGHYEVSRFLAHQTWFKAKRDEVRMKRNCEEYAAQLYEKIAKEQEIMNTEKRISVEQSFKEWHLKNNFVYNPYLFGQVGYDGKNRKITNKIKKTSEGCVLNVTKRNKVLKNEMFTKTNDRTVNFLPLSDPFK